MFRSFALILSGNLSNTLLGMLRSLLAAALISLEDFGIAATFMVAMAVIEMVSALGLKQQIVQAREGNDPAFQAALQGFQLLRGLVNGMALVVLAWPMAWFFGLSDLVWAYQLVALAPVLRAFEHFDAQRLARQMNYWPTLISGALPALGSLLAVWPLYLMFGDFRVLLFAVLLQAALSVLASHLVARRPYQLRFDRAIMATSLRFGWPIMLNGILMFVIFNGDRMIVGRELGMATLAVFSMALSLTMAPVGLLAGVLSKFFLPQLSASKDDPAEFAALSVVTIQAHLVLGALLVAGVGLLGGPFLHLALGEKYAAAIPLLTWLALMQGCRVGKGASSVIALAVARTGNATIANIPRVLLLLPAWYAAATGQGLLVVIWLGILGEILGLVIALWLVMSRLSLPWRPLVPVLVVSAVLAGVAISHASRLATGGWMPDPWTGAGLAILLGLSLAASRQLRGYVARRQIRRYDES